MFDFLFEMLSFQGLAFKNTEEFIAMGKHGFYVWLCYGLSLLTVLVNMVLYIWKRSRIIKDIRDNLIRKQKQAQNLGQN